ncbi:DUF3107 domain-containing protein [Nocardioides alcanivorans]|uniref:DUF3107 domain-containing protein n=1 Tax=Nocardioides alcanivorans TaxID=2897352 RepID=UPI001F40B7D0|nr:DUF3107 domain-containing protein [Nocardioides alcanivorans]
MEIKIGIQQSAREIVLDVDTTAADVEARVAEAVSSDGLLSLTDIKGRSVLVPSARLAYVEIGSSTVGTVGFRS